MPWPTSRELLFSVRTFFAGMLALYIGLAIDLPRPYWSLLTVYIIAQPLSGMVRSKGLYRVIGTVVGASFGLAALTALRGSPELLTATMALWVGMCAYCSIAERSPASYGFLLAGLSAAIVVFPTVNAPETVFQVALARCEEIILGVLCVTLVGDVIFPQRVGPVLMTRLDAWLDTARTAFCRILTGDAPELKDMAETWRFAGENDSLRMLRIQAAYDTAQYRAAAGWVTLLQRRMQPLFAILVSIDDRQRALHARRPDLLAATTPLREAVARYVQTPATDRREVTKLHAAIEQAMPGEEAIRADWDRLLLRTLLARLHDLVDRWRECRSFERAVRERRPGPRTRESLMVYRDHLMAAVAGAAAAAVVVVNTSFWIATAWPSGGSAALLGTVAASFFSAADDPAPLARNFGVVAVAGAVLMLIYKFAIFPLIDGFPLLVAVLAPLYLTVGLLMQHPRFGPLALLTAVLFTAQTALQGSPSGDFASSLNSAIAIIVGVAFAYVTLKITRPLGGELVVRRLVAATYRDLARVATGDRRLERGWFETRMVDRLAGLVTRLGDVGWSEQGRVLRTLAELRVGLALFRLRDVEAELPAAATRAVGELRQLLSGHFRACVRNPDREPDAVVGPLDKTIRTIAATPVSPATTEALVALAGVRQGLVPLGVALMRTAGDAAAQPVAA